MSEEKDQKDMKATHNQVALELMKFVATTTNYGKGPAAPAGFGGRSGAKSPEEHADALLDLFRKCRTVVQDE